MCVSELRPQEAALLAGIVASPTAYDPIAHPETARARRSLVLKDMLDQRYLSRQQYAAARVEALPAASQIQPPQQSGVTPSTPYFIDWVKQQLVDRFGAQRAFEGGLACYPAGGTVDGRSGDHVLLAPPYIATSDDIDMIVDRLGIAVDSALKTIGH